MRIIEAIVLITIVVKIALGTWRDLEAKVKADRDEPDHDRR